MKVSLSLRNAAKIDTASTESETLAGIRHCLSFLVTLSAMFKENFTNMMYRLMPIRHAMAVQP